MIFANQLASHGWGVYHPDFRFSEHVDDVFLCLKIGYTPVVPGASVTH